MIAVSTKIDDGIYFIQVSTCSTHNIGSKISVRAISAHMIDLTGWSGAPMSKKSLILTTWVGKVADFNMVVTDMLKAFC